MLTSDRSFNLNDAMSGIEMLSDAMDSGVDMTHLGVPASLELARLSGLLPVGTAEIT